MPDAQVDQAGLFQTRNDPHLDACLVLDRLNQVAAVGRLTDGAGGHCLDPREAAVVGECGERADYFGAFGDSARGEGAGRERLLAQARHVLEPVKDLVGKVGLDFRQNHVD